MKTRECIKWLWRASHDVRGHILSNSLIGILHVASSLTFVWICKTLVDIVTTGTGSHLTTYILAMVGCQLLQVILTALEQRISSHSDILLKNKLRYLLFTRLMESRWNGKENFHTGDTLNRVMEDVRIVADSITASIPAVLTAAVQFIAAFIFLFSLQPDLAWVIPGIMIAALLISKNQCNAQIKPSCMRASSVIIFWFHGGSHTNSMFTSPTPSKA